MGRPIVIGLDPRVRESMSDLFRGKTCIACGKQAERIQYARKKKLDEYYCHGCYHNTIKGGK